MKMNVKQIWKNRTQLSAQFAGVNVENIESATLRAKARNLKAKQAGFTLLELLVVVAILAALAGIATVAFKDTDARASAAAHVAMMNELNKGVWNFQKLNKEFPTQFDSLLTTTNSSLTDSPATIEFLSTLEGADGVTGFEGALTIANLDSETAGLLGDQGISSLMGLNATRTYNISSGTGTATCANDNLADIINSRKNNVVPGNVYLGQFDVGDDGSGGGCGAVETLGEGSSVAIWTGGSLRLTGVDKGTFTSAATTALLNATTHAADQEETPVYMAVGFGPSSTLFDTENLAGMTAVPVYRHVSGETYNRFVGMFELGKYNGTASSNKFVTAEQIELRAIVDGAGDTKEEELGEWDGQRNTL